MSYSVRTFLVGPDDTRYRLASAMFSRLIDDPATHRLARFAGQRVRLAEAIVEIHERTPRAVVRLIFEMLRFDEEGRLDLPAFLRQNAALAELAMGRVLAPAATPGETIVDASSRFVAQGGCWQPSPSLERNIRRAALGALSCERV